MMKKGIKKVLRIMGYELKKLDSSLGPVGSMTSLLEDLKVKGIYPKSILDIGANHGNWSRMAKGIFPKAKCFMIEPQIEMKPFLDKFCNDFPDSKWFLAGAGSKEEESVLYIWDDLAGSSFLKPAGANKKKRRKIPIITVDSLIERKKIEKPELIKIDIQGFELEALKGGQKLFKNAEVFILEVSLFRFSPKIPLINEVIDFMIKRGYFIYDFLGFLRRPFDGALGQADICFVKENGVLRLSNRWN